jgi:hypothetical protein
VIWTGQVVRISSNDGQTPRHLEGLTASYEKVEGVEEEEMVVADV